MTRRTEARLLAIIALAAVGIYSMSCKPAWSPEGDKVAYILGRQKGEQGRYAVAIYDLKTKQSETIGEQFKSEKEAGLCPFEVFWPKHGHEILYLSTPADGDHGNIIVVSAYDLKTKTTKQVQYDLEKIKTQRSSDETGSQDSLSYALSPVLLQHRRWLWLSGDDGCRRVDLTGKKVRQLKQAQVVFGNEERIFFVAEGSGDSIIFGRVKTFLGVRETPLFTVSARENETIIPVLAVPKDCVRFACVKSRDNKQTLALYDKKGACTKEIDLPESLECDDHGVAGAEWNPDGSILWLATKGEDEAGKEYTGIAEIQIDNGAVRIIKVNEDRRYGDLLPLHLSLSPTGSHLAASVMNTEAPESDEYAGLCLVDLTTSDRNVTLLLPPELVTPAPSKT